jgi:hypothetical protein
LLAFESYSLESTGRLLESVSNYRSRWMMISSKELQDPAYRATLLSIFPYYRISMWQMVLRKLTSLQSWQ